MNRVLLGGKHIITGKYGTDLGRQHLGVDLVATTNGQNKILDYIVAHSDGVVKELMTTVRSGSGDRSKWIGKTYGNYILLEHSGGIQTLYAHLQYGRVGVKLGQKVKKGDIIGYMGSTGWSTGGHLHFEVRNKNVKINPTPYLYKDLDNYGTQDIVEEIVNTRFSVGDVVVLNKGATFIGGQKPLSFLFNSKLYVREVRKNGDIVISTLEKGAVTGAVNQNALTLVTKATVSKPSTTKPVEEKPAEAELKVGDKVILNGDVTAFGNNTGNRIKYKNKTMYVVDVLPENQYTNNIGLALKKGGARNGWANKKYIRKV